MINIKKQNMERNFGIAAKAIIENEKGKYLILYKSKIEDINPNEIDLPGGRIRFGEDIEESLKREVKEELGINIQIIKPLRVWSFVKGHLHLVGITFLAKYIGGRLRLSKEHTSCKWVDKEEILNGRCPEWIKEEFKVIRVISN